MNMGMNLKLKNKIRDAQKSYSECARALNISSPTFSSRINGKSTFKVPEVVILSDLLHMSNEEKLEIFLS